MVLEFGVKKQSAWSKNSMDFSNEATQIPDLFALKNLLNDYRFIDLLCLLGVSGGQRQMIRLPLQSRCRDRIPRSSRYLLVEHVVLAVSYRHS